jgi:hypothetical protein
MQQLAEDGEERPQLGKRIKSLEKEVHYYKKLCKELRTRRKDHDPDLQPDHGDRGDHYHDPKDHGNGQRENDISPRDRYYGHRAQDYSSRERDHGTRNPTPGVKYHDQEVRGHVPRDLRDQDHGSRDRSARAHLSSRNQHERDEVSRRNLQRQADLEMVELVGEERGGEGASDAESAVSQIQPSHILQFQRRLARLHR